MPFLADVERVAVVGAEGEEGRGVARDQRDQLVQVLRDRALADQDRHALGEFFARLLGGRRLVVGADAGGEIGVEVDAAQQRRMPVDMAGGKCLQLGEAGGVAMDHAGKVHEFGEPDHLRMVHEGHEIGGFQPRAGGLQMRRGHAARQIDPEVHPHRLRAGKKIAESLGAQDIRDLMRIADRGGDAMRQHAALEFQRRHQRGFDVQMGVDEAGHGNQPGRVDHLAALIVAIGPDDRVAADGDIGLDQPAADQVEQLRALDHEVGRLVSAPLRDPEGQFLSGDFGSVGHGRGPCGGHGGKVPCLARPCRSPARDQSRTSSKIALIERANPD